MDLQYEIICLSDKNVIIKYINTFPSSNDLRLRGYGYWLINCENCIRNEIKSQQGNRKINQLNSITLV